MTTTAACETPDVSALMIITSLMIYAAFFSYVPYHVKLLREKNTHGVSLSTVFLLTFSMFSNSVGGTIQNWQNFQCCGQGKWSGGDCYVALTPLLVILAYFVGILPLCLMCVYYFTPSFEIASLHHERSPVLSTNEGEKAWQASFTEASASVAEVTEFKYANPRTRKRAYVIFACLLLYMVVIVIVAASIMKSTGSHSSAASGFAFACNIVAGCFMLISWLPQMIHTYMIKSAGSVSVTSLGIQAPQTLLLVVMLLLDGQKITIVLPAIVSFLCMCVIVSLCIKYIRQEKEAKEEADRDYVEDGSSSDEAPRAEP